MAERIRMADLFRLNLPEPKSELQLAINSLRLALACDDQNMADYWQAVINAIRAEMRAHAGD